MPGMRKFVGPAVLLGILLGGCTSGGGAGITAPHDTFMLSYLDESDTIRLRWSQDGFRWQDGTFPDISSTAGVGAAVSDDTRGTLRWVAFRAADGTLKLATGLGASFTGEGFSDPSIPTFGVPRMAEARTGFWLVTTLDRPFVPQQPTPAAVVHLLDADDQLLTDVTPADVPGMTNADQLVPPSVAARNGEVLLAWMNWQSTFGVPIPGAVQTIRGSVASDGAVSWSGAQTFDVAEPGFSQFQSMPVVSHDGTRFLLGVVRRANDQSEMRFFIYESEDRTNWTLHDSLTIFADSFSTFQLAAHAGRVMLVSRRNNQGDIAVYRRYEGQWQELADGNVFGNRPPGDSLLSMVAAGRARNPIFVDGNYTGPEHGTQNQPFSTIGAALEQASRGDVVQIGFGAYAEKPVVPAGVTLQGIGPADVQILNQADTDPLITAAGDNVIRNMILQGQNQGVTVDPSALLGTLQGAHAEVFLTVENVQARGSNRGVEVVVPAAQNYGADNRRVLRLRVNQSQFRNMSGVGLISDIQGPSSGELQISLDVRDNVFSGLQTGMSFNMNGNAQNTGGFVKASYAGHVINNLLIENGTGVQLTGADAGHVAMTLGFNTIADSGFDAISSGSADGPNGAGRVHVDLLCNILASSQQGGYLEFDGNTSVRTLQNNLFFNNGVHYLDFETDTQINNAAGLNSTQTVPIVGGVGNVIADPGFVSGPGYDWFGTVAFDTRNDFFLGPDSPAVDGCVGTVDQHSLTRHTTAADLSQDTNPPDIGWHYRAAD